MESEEEEVVDDEQFRQEFYQHLAEEGVLPPGVDANDLMRVGRDTVEDDYDDSDNDSHVSMPHLEDGDSDDDDDSMPNLVNRRGQPNDSSDDDDDDDEDMPALVNRQDDDSSSDGSVPPLMGRRDADDDTSSDGSVPPLMGRRDNGNSSDEESMPDLLARERVDDDSSDDSMPTALQRGAMGDSDSDDSVPPPLGRRGSTEARAQRPQPAPGNVFDDLRGGRPGVYLVKNDETDLEWTNGHQTIALEMEPSRSPVPCKTGYIEVSNDNYVIGHSYSGDHANFEYEIDGNSQIVSDGGDGIWTLSSHGGLKTLKYYSDEFPDGKNVRRVSEQSTLIQGLNDAAWVHVKRGSETIEAGLWFFKTRGQKKVRAGEEIAADAKVAPDGNGAVWVMQSKQGSTYISHVTRTDRRPYRDSRVPCDFTKDSKVITSANNGVYVHTRKDNQWALFFYKNDMLHRRKICPKTAKVVADRHGNAWAMEKSGSERILYKVNGPANTVETISQRHPAGTIMLGAY